MEAFFGDKYSESFDADEFYHPDVVIVYIGFVVKLSALLLTLTVSISEDSLSVLTETSPPGPAGLLT